MIMHVLRILLVLALKLLHSEFFFFFYGRAVP